MNCTVITMMAITKLKTVPFWQQKKKKKKKKPTSKLWFCTNYVMYWLIQI